MVGGRSLTQEVGGRRTLSPVAESVLAKISLSANLKARGDRSRSPTNRSAAWRKCCAARARLHAAEREQLQLQRVAPQAQARAQGEEGESASARRRKRRRSAKDEKRRAAGPSKLPLYPLPTNFASATPCSTPHATARTSPRRSSRSTPTTWYRTTVSVDAEKQTERSRLTKPKQANIPHIEGPKPPPAAPPAPAIDDLGRLQRAWLAAPPPQPRAAARAAAARAGAQRPGGRGG